MVFNNDQKVILFWLLVPIVLAWLIAFFIPNYQPFRLLLILPAFYLLLILGIAKIENIKIRIVSILFVLLVNLISLSVYFDNPFFHREDWKGAVAFIEKQGENNSLALLPSQTSFWPWEYYAKDKVQLITVAQGFNIVQAEDLKNLEVIKDKDRVYFIYYLADVFDPQNLIPNWLEEENFDKIREVSFNQIRIQEWQKK
ncbi:hypothetical protein FJZ41_02815 [Candidatus Shapirobacteria bacterium]|nr:hypothetical protein [Candidatus Shapirobacteria bacterium]